eukprot:m51a1_g6329 hypothetical protein (450) ;mRNA; f:5471-7064
MDEKMAYLTGSPTLPILRRHFERQGELSEGAALRLISEARAITEREPNVLVVDNGATEVIVVGDLHGQFYDMLSMMDFVGLPCSGKTVVFLGDYIDRGCFGTEIMLYLCACKILHPGSIFLLRGNHESRPMCDRDGFTCECEAKYTEGVFLAFMDLFRTLPLACLVVNTPYGSCFCTHGGIGPSLSTVAEISSIDRFVEVPEDGTMTDLLWADPLPEWEAGREECAGHTPGDWAGLSFVPNSDRHTSWFYGFNAVAAFLQRNNLCCIIRGHQVQENGFMAHFVEGASLPRVITLFSAPNYCDTYENVGSFLRVSNTRGFQVQQLRSVDHPVVLPNYQDAFTYSIPAITDTVVRTLQALVSQIGKERREGLSEQERLWDEILAYKTRRLYEKAEKLRLQKEKILQVSVPENLSRFQAMLLKDKETEARPRASAGSSAPKKLPFRRSYSTS